MDGNTKKSRFWHFFLFRINFYKIWLIKNVHFFSNPLFKVTVSPLQYCSDRKSIESIKINFYRHLNIYSKKEVILRMQKDSLTLIRSIRLKLFLRYLFQFHLSRAILRWRKMTWNLSNFFHRISISFFQKI